MSYLFGDNEVLQLINNMSRRLCDRIIPLEQEVKRLAEKVNTLEQQQNSNK